jgi:hypothetical protein
VASSLAELPGAPAAPSAEERAELLDILGELVAAGGPERLLLPPVTPGDEDFPEPWTPTPFGVATLLRRLFAHAQVPMDVLVRDRRADAGPAPRRPTTEVELVAVRGGRARFSLFSIGADDIGGTLAHEVGVAARMALVRRASPYRMPAVAMPGETDRLRGSVAAVYLGLGVLATNAAFQEYLGGSYKMHLGYAPMEQDIIRAGHLEMDALAFVLAVQAEVRGAELPRGLRPPQTDAARAWRSALSGHGPALRELLGIGALPAAPQRPAPAPLSAVDEGDVVQVLDAPAARKTYRVRYTSTGLGMLAGFVTGAAIATAALLPMPAALAVAGGASVLGAALGRRRVRHRCAECLTPVSLALATCPGCGCELGGEIASRDQRLDD